MDKIRQLLQTHLSLYPGMEPVDCIKLVYQNEMGLGHLVDDRETFCLRLRQEMEKAEISRFPSPEPIGNRLCRVHLAAVDAALNPGTLARLCVLGAEQHHGAEPVLRQKLETLRGFDGEGWLPYSQGRLKACVNEYLNREAEVGAGPQPRHSERFTALYQPHYRVLPQHMALFLPVFAAIDKALAQKPHVLVGLDGMSGAGKSSLAGLLVQVYGCGVVHADDFFLQPEQRTPKRLAEPGGNIDYERFAPVVQQAADDRTFCYQAYDCATGRLAEWKEVQGGPLTAVEGSYTLHPAMREAYDLRVFLAVDADTQRQRIARRNGALAARFKQEWIPMENRYFLAFDVRAGCDLVVDTSSL